MCKSVLVNYAPRIRKFFYTATTFEQIWPRLLGRCDICQNDPWGMRHVYKMNCSLKLLLCVLAYWNENRVHAIPRKLLQTRIVNLRSQFKNPFERLYTSSWALSLKWPRLRAKSLCDLGSIFWVSHRLNMILVKLNVFISVWMSRLREDSSSERADRGLRIHLLPRLVCWHHSLI